MPIEINLRPRTLEAWVNKFIPTSVESISFLLSQKDAVRVYRKYTLEIQEKLKFFSQIEGQEDYMLFAFCWDDLEEQPDHINQIFESILHTVLSLDLEYRKLAKLLRDTNSKPKLLKRVYENNKDLVEKYYQYFTDSCYNSNKTDVVKAYTVKQKMELRK